MVYISGNIVIRKNGHKRIWRIKSERTRNESQKLKMQNFVGGLIECIPLTDTDSEVTLVCNDEGKLLNLTPNRLLWNGADYLAGPGFIAGTDGEGNLASLPPQEMNYYAKKFRAFLIAL